MKKIAIVLVMLCAGCAPTKSVTRIVVESKVPPPTYQPNVAARIELEITH